MEQNFNSRTAAKEKIPVSLRIAKRHQTYFFGRDIGLEEILTAVWVSTMRLALTRAAWNA
jgi:hypothetical protein